MLKPFTVQAQACPLRAAWRGTQFEGGKGLSLRRFGDKAQDQAHNRYTVEQKGQTLGLLLGSGWTCDQFAAFVPWRPQGADQVLDFDQEIRFETAQELRWFLSDLASRGLEEALENYYVGYNL